MSAVSENHESAGAPPTVLHYVGYERAGGGMLAALQALASGGGAFSSVLGVGPRFAAHARPSLPHLALPRVAAEQLGLRTWWQCRRVAREAQAWLRVDPMRVFHGHSRAGLVTAQWLRSWGETRVIATVHCYGRHRWFYRAAARVLGHDLYWLGPSMKQYYDVGDASWENCLPDCVPAETLRPPAKLPRASGRLTLGCVGALVPVKQWDLVLDALARVPASVPLTIIHAGGEDGSAGSAAYAAHLRKRAAALELGSRWEWRGEVADMEGFYSSIDALVVAARLEASSMAVLEAGAAGVPVLASDQSGTRDLVHTARLGWTFKSDSAEALAEALVRLTSGPELARWRRDDVALRGFLAPSVAAQHADIYQQLVRR